MSSSKQSTVSGEYETLTLGGNNYWLVPKEENPRAVELLRFDDPRVRNYEEYTYDPLPQGKKRIRLMRLYHGEPTGAKIYCELIEADYDKEFHIPKIPDTSEDVQGRNEDTAQPVEGEGIDEAGPPTPYQQETDEEARERKKRQDKRELERLVNELKRDSEERERKKEKDLQDKFERWEKVKKVEQPYEALSWCWGNAAEEYVILIKKGPREILRKRVRRELALALKYLRRPDKARTLWIDAICINQANKQERNHQVQMMSRIYTRAEQVCIWLGEADADSETAMKFIKDEMKELKNFDTISSNKQYSRKWQALMSLMQRDWFFRRWVIQEIALAGDATVYCGIHSVPWKSFAVAVELFVEVETATHRLSEVMKRDEKFRHVPGWFEYVSELGASQLVQATGKVFRTPRTPMGPDREIDREDDSGFRKRTEQEQKTEKEEEEKRIKESLRETATIDPLGRRCLLSLEYLVSSMNLFQASEPRDVIYALLGIGRDASPFAPAQYGQEDRNLFLVMTLLDRFLAEKPFVVDYNRPYADHDQDQANSKRVYINPRTKWYKRERKIERRPSSSDKSQDQTNSDQPFKFWYPPEEDKGTWSVDYRDTKTYMKDIIERKHVKQCPEADDSHEHDMMCRRGHDEAAEEWKKLKKKYFPAVKLSEDGMALPSWVAPASQAPFILDNSPGMHMQKTSRANADPLVGLPQDGRRNYNAAGPEGLDLKTLKFRKRPHMGEQSHYSLYVKGFELDTVVTVEDTSQLGSIPKTWLDAGKWKDLSKDPPDEFWRTIVADRGPDNKNPPYYYGRACKESVHRGGHRGGSVNTVALIHDEQNSIVAEFCRRVHAVIWNRCLFRTKADRLGIGNKVKEGDKVCILYGCTVPVILREHKKETAQKSLAEVKKLEVEEDSVQSLKSCVVRAENNRVRMAEYRRKKKKNKEEWEKKKKEEWEKQNNEGLEKKDKEDWEKKSKEEWQEMMDARLAFLEESRESKTRKRKSDEDRDIEQQHQKQKKQKMRELAEKIKDKDKDEQEEEIKDFLDKKYRSATTPAPSDISSEATTGTSRSQEASESGDGTHTTPSSSSADSRGSQVRSAPQDEDVWYEFIGECYVHGMMDGEAMREKFYKDILDHVFELR